MSTVIVKRRNRCEYEESQWRDPSPSSSSTWPGKDGRAATYFGADLAIRKIRGATALPLALLYRGEEVQEPWNRTHQELLQIFISQYWAVLRLMRLLLREGVSIDARESESCTPLCHACGDRNDGGNDAVAELLLNEGAQVTAKPSSGQTVLYHAAMSGYENIVKQLIGRGELETKDINGRTLLHLACFKGKDSVIDLLVNSGAKLKAKDSVGDRSAHCISRRL